MFTRNLVERYVPLAILLLTWPCACNQPDVAELPKQSRGIADRNETQPETESNGRDIADAPAGQGEAGSGEMESDAASGVSEDDLIFAAPSGEAESPARRSEDLAVLDDAFEIVERYDDGSLQRRWFARLYVTFDRGRPWHQQKPGSWTEHGAYEEFYPDGQQPLTKGTFHDGQRQGEWIWWHPNGQIAKAGTYQNAKLQGEWRYFREDGTLLRIEQYDAHQKVGTWRYFDTDGETVIREETHTQ